MKCMGNGLPKIVHQQILNLKTYNTGWDTDDNKYNLPQNIGSRQKLLLANSGDPDQTPHNAASDLGLHCLPMYPF